MTDDLGARIDDFDSCVLSRDAEAAATVLDDDYALVLVVPARAVMPRDRWLAVLPDYVVSAWTIEDQVVDEDGDVAVVIRRVAMQATVPGEDRSGVFVLTDTWRKRADGWRVWRRHSTPLTAAALPGA